MGNPAFVCEVNTEYIALPVNPLICSLDLIRSIQEQMLEVQKALKVEPQPERMLRAKEVAVLLNVNPKTIWNWKKKGTLVPVPIGSHEYFPESAVLRLKS